MSEQSSSLWTFGLAFDNNHFELDEWVVDHWPTLGPGDLHIEIHNRATGYQSAITVGLEDLENPAAAVWYMFPSPEAAIRSFLEERRRIILRDVVRLSEQSDILLKAEGYLERLINTEEND